MKHHLIMNGFILFWLVSPESLAISGREAGLSGRMVLVPLAAAMGLTVLCAALIHDRRPPGPDNEFVSLSWSLFGMAFLLFFGFDFHRPGNQCAKAIYTEGRFTQNTNRRNEP